MPVTEEQKAKVEWSSLWLGAIIVMIGISAGSIFAAIAARAERDYAREYGDELRLRHDSARECCRQTQGEYVQCIEAFGIGGKP
jgi:hypothetical protein